jgi:short-subunit dehydrogenase
VKKKFTLITGASSGIGEALANKFAAEGNNLILVARRKDRLETLSQKLSSEFKIHSEYLVKDLSKSNEIEELLKKIEEKDLFVNILINNAGLGDFNLFSNSEKTKNHRLIDTNIRAVVDLNQYFVPKFIKQGEGKILHVASMAAFMPGPYIAVYAASKAFILNYSIALSSELEELGLQVSVLCPGDIETEFQKNANLEKFEVNSKISLDELVDFTFVKFIYEEETVIIPPETRKHIDMMTRSGSAEIISRNLYKMRKMLKGKMGHK